MSSKGTRVTPCVIVGLWIAWALLVIFLFGLPTWSRIANNAYFDSLCQTPAEYIVCGDGQNYMDIARKLNRHRIVQRRKRYYGCGCGEGFFGDAACMVQSEPIHDTIIPLGQQSFSISYFIGSAPGTGFMATFTTIPILGMWLYGSGNVENIHPESVSTDDLKLIRYTLVVFQIFFGLFLSFPFCILPVLHDLVVWIFLGSLILHFVAISREFGTDSRTGRVINSLVASGIVAIVGGVLYPPNPTWLGQHAFYLGECIGLSIATVVAPILISFWEVRSDARGLHEAVTQCDPLE